jgi:hypothetical protein
MNKQNILAVADAIEHATLAKEIGLGFNMSAYASADSANEYNRLNTEHTCGTVACIAGWAVTMFEKDGTPREVALDPRALVQLDDTAIGVVSEHAAAALGLSSSIASQLFAPDITGSYDDIEPERAVETLRHMAETGFVDWGDIADDYGDLDGSEDDE